MLALLPYAFIYDLVFLAAPLMRLRGRDRMMELWWLVPFEATAIGQDGFRGFASLFPLLVAAFLVRELWSARGRCRRAGPSLPPSPRSRLWTAGLDARPRLGYPCDGSRPPGPWPPAAGAPRERRVAMPTPTSEANELIRLLGDQHTFAHHALEGASAEAVNWKPASTPCDSLAGLVHHIVEVQRLWLDTVIGGEPVPPGLATAHAATGQSGDELARLLDDSLAKSKARLESLAPSQLDEERERRGRTVTVRWAAYHTLEHTAMHVGHMQITRQVYDDQAGATPKRQGPGGPDRDS